MATIYQGMLSRQPIDAGGAKLSDADLYRPHWTMLKGTLDTLLGNDPGTYPSFSYEAAYSAVYKCVCLQCSDKLLQDLQDTVQEHLHMWKDDLMSLEDQQTFVRTFKVYLVRFRHSLDSILPVFTYLNRFYVVPKLNADLKDILVRLFGSVMRPEVTQRLFGYLNASLTQSFLFPPDVIQPLVLNLNALDSSFSAEAPDVFRRHLDPTQARLMAEEELAAQIEADKKLQEELRRNGFASQAGGGGGQKRALDEDEEDGGDKMQT